MFKFLYLKRHFHHIFLSYSQVSGESRGRPRKSFQSVDDLEIWGACLPIEHPLKEHDYCKSLVDHKSIELSDDILQELTSLQSKVNELRNENQQLRGKRLLLDQSKLDNDKFNFWTSLPNYDTFKTLFKYLNVVGVDKTKMLERI